MLYPAKHYLRYIYIEWALSPSSEMNLITASLASLVVLMSAFLLVSRLFTFALPRSMFWASQAIVEENRKKFAIAGFTLLSIAFPYYRELIKALVELAK